MADDLPRRREWFCKPLIEKIFLTLGTSIALFRVLLCGSLVVTGRTGKKEEESHPLGDISGSAGNQETEFWQPIPRP